MTHFLRREQYLIFLDIAAEYRNLRNSAERKQTRTDGPVGDSPQVLHGGLVRGQTDDEDLAQNR